MTKILDLESYKKKYLDQANTLINLESFLCKLDRKEKQGALTPAEKQIKSYVVEFSKN